MTDPDLWSTLLGTVTTEIRATPRAALDPDEVLPPGLHDHDRRAAEVLLSLAAGNPGFHTTLLARVLHPDHLGHTRLEIASDRVNVTVTATPDEETGEDRLTGLPGPAILMDRVDQALLAASRSGRQVGVVHVDIDGFDRIQRVLGSVAADEMLRQVAYALERALRPADTLSRLGRDDFVAVTPDLRSPADAAVVAERLLEAVAELPAEATAGGLEASIGIAIADATASAEDLLSRAGRALAAARAAGGGRWLVDGFDADDGELSTAHVVRAALDEGRVDAWYQPVCDPDGAVLRVEAMIFVPDVLSDRVPAEEVLVAAARAGLQSRLDLRVVERVAGQLAAWEEQGLRLDASVNVSAATAARSDLVDAVGSALAGNGLAPGRIRVEVPAEALGDGSVGVVVAALRSAGIGVAANRWDGDRAALDRAIALGLAEVKLCPSVVSSLPAHRDAAGELAAAVEHAASAGVEVTAVGVETSELYDLARVIGCSGIQGYVRSGPVPATRITAMLRS